MTIRKDVVKKILAIAKDNKRMGWPEPVDAALTFWNSHLKKMFEEDLSVEEINEVKKKARNIKVKMAG